MTAPEAVPSDCAWLRTNPTTLPSSTPKTFKALITGGDAVWLQVYKDWLVGTTNGAPNAPKVEAGISADELVRWFGELARDPGKASSEKPGAGALSDVEKAMAKALGRAPAPADKVRTFERVYAAAFVPDVDTVRTMVEARVKQLRDEAKAAGKSLSAKEAGAQAGKEAQRLTLANAAASEGKVLDVNVAMAVQVQVEKYKATSLQLFNTSLNQISDVQWDTEEDGGGDKATAVRVMGAAGTAVLTAAAHLKDVSDRLKKPRQTEALSPAELESALFDALIEFSEAIAKQGEAMTKTGQLIAKWAKRSTANKIRKDFDTIYPELGAALLGLRTAVSLSQALLDFFPPFNSIGTALSLSDQALEFAIKELIVWKTKQDEEVQQKYAGKEFAVDRAQLNIATRTAVGLTEFKEKLDDYTSGLPVRAVKAVVVPSGKALAGLVGADKSTQGSVGRGLTKVIDWADTNKEHLGVTAPLSISAVISTLGASVPGMGIVMTAKTVMFDIAAYTTAQVKVLQNETGLSDQDVEDIKALMRDKSANPFHTAFASGEIQVEPKQPGAPVTYARVGGIRLRITHGPDARVDNADDATVDKNIRHLTMNALKDKIAHDGRYFVPDWSGVVPLRAEHKHPLYSLTVPATVAIGGTSLDVVLKLSYDMEADDARVVAVDGDLPVDAISQKLGVHKKPMGFEQLAPERANEITVTLNDIELTFPGRVVTHNGETYTLTKDPTGGHTDTNAGVVEFSMDAKGSDNAAYRLDLLYRLGGGLEVEAAEAKPDLFAKKVSGEVLLVADDIVNRFQGAKIAFAEGMSATEYVLGALKAGPFGGKGAPVTFQMTATSAGGTAISVDLSYTAATGLEVVGADPSPAQEERRRKMTMAGRRVNILTGALTN
jgi:hypothetical protein